MIHVFFDRRVSCVGHVGHVGGTCLERQVMGGWIR